ncbi:MAG TPA: LysR family transcriptional regulator [Solirubrobacteraceae bacterium]|nr:LysR family transcriptional regulator [Solirubrobacteraceae bacterium]
MAPTTSAHGGRSPDIIDLRSLCAAAELGSLGRAAIRLHISQPALSKRLHNLEALVGVQLLERSSHGVKLTPAGRRLYEQARKLLQQADAIDEVISAVKRAGGPVRLAASHSAVDGFVGEGLGKLGQADGRLRVELVSANSSVVRDLVADGRADLGVAASRPHHTPYPGVRELPVTDDEVVCAVPRGHPWCMRDRISLREFLRTPMVMRDVGSNSRWTVDAVLTERGLQAAAPLVEAASPQAARREAHAHRAPILVSRLVLTGHDFHELPIEGLRFPRQFVLVLPAYGEPAGDVARLAELLREAASDWAPRDGAAR